MNILFINPFWKPYRGGIEKVIEKLSFEFLRYSVVKKIGILSSTNLYPTGSVKNDIEKSNDGQLIVYRLNFFPNNLPFITNLKNSGYFSLGIDRVLEDFKPDIIQYMTDGWYLPNLYIYLKYKNKAKHIYSPFYHDIKDIVSNKPMILANTYLCNNVNKIIVYSENEKLKINKIYKAPLEKIELLKLGVDIPTGNINKNKNYICILSVGRIGYAKGQYDLLRIFHKLTKVSKVNLKLILVGKDGGDLENIKNYITQYQLNDIVQVLTNCDDSELDNLYSYANIFAHATKYEAFGLASVEALAHKTPVITFEAGAVSEVLKKGAILIKPFDYESMLQNLMKLVENKELQEKLGNEGYEYVKKHYAWKNVAKKFINLYKT